jgi:putative ABC transport system permease protein
MWLISLRDLRWRSRRFLISVLATGLAFGLTLVMTGVMAHMRNESKRTVALYDADHWVVASGSSGPFTAVKYLDAHVADELGTAPGEAAPLLMARTTVGSDDVNVVGYTPDSPSQPRALAHIADRTAGVVADTALGLHVGETVSFGERTYPVVGTVSKTTYYFDTPTVFLPIDDVQRDFFSGQAIASTIVVRGDLGTPPAGVDVLSDQQVRADLDRVIDSTGQTISVINTLLWVMAAGIVAAMVYITTLERTRDFAVLKAIGARTGSLTGGLVVQAALLALAAAALSVGIAAAIAPTFSFDVEIPRTAYAELVVVALVVGSLAAAAGMRRVTRIDPALAFGGQ